MRQAPAQQSHNYKNIADAAGAGGNSVTIAQKLQFRVGREGLMAPLSPNGPILPWPYRHQAAIREDR
jgi:hypothetical protein